MRGRERGGSLGNIEELFKRKRVEEEGEREVEKEELFKKSKVTVRSPQKVGRREEKSRKQQRGRKVGRDSNELEREYGGGDERV